MCEVVYKMFISKILSRTKKLLIISNILRYYHTGTIQGKSIWEDMLVDESLFGFWKVLLT